jgi:hypothetical protein
VSAQAPLLSTKLHAPDPRDRIGREALVARVTLDSSDSDPIRFWA